MVSRLFIHRMKNLGYDHNNEVNRVTLAIMETDYLQVLSSKLRKMTLEYCAYRIDKSQFYISRPKSFQIIIMLVYHSCVKDIVPNMILILGVDLDICVIDPIEKLEVARVIFLQNT